MGWGRLGRGGVSEGERGEGDEELTVAVEDERFEIRHFAFAVQVLGWSRMGL